MPCIWPSYTNRMNTDMNSVATLLRVNGLTKESPAEDIRAALASARYSESESEVILATLEGKEPLVVTGAAFTPAGARAAVGIPTPAKYASRPKRSSAPLVTFLIVVLLVAGGIAALYVLGGIGYLSRTLNQPMLCDIVPFSEHAGCLPTAAQIPSE